jgi:hypothetical protein
MKKIFAKIYSDYLKDGGWFVVLLLLMVIYMVGAFFVRRMYIDFNPFNLGKFILDLFWSALFCLMLYSIYASREK